MEEERKEKKTIKCSYAFLVIILCAVIAFLTDYIVIDRKTRTCNCPKCEATNNEVISDNTIYSYEDVTGYYTFNDMHYYLYSNGKFIAESKDDSYGYVGFIGNYIIENSKIVFNTSLAYSSSSENTLYIRPGEFKGSINIYGTNEIGNEDVSNGVQKFEKRANIDEYANKYEDLLKSDKIVNYSESILTSINPAANDAPGMAD